MYENPLGMNFFPVLILLALGVTATVANEDALKAIRASGGTVTAMGSEWVIGFEHGGRDLDDRGLEAVAELGATVRSLNLRDTKITDAGLKHLATFSGLRRLHLERTAIGDAGLVHLAKLDKLEVLNLYGTKTSDAGLEKLMGLRRLRQLFVWQTEVTDAGCRRLQASLPGLKIFRGVDLDKVAAEMAVAKAEEEKIERVVLDWVPAGTGTVPRSQTGEFTTVDITNPRPRTVKLYWSEYGGGLRFYQEIASGETVRRNTYSRAVWVITERDETPLGHFVCPEDPGKITIPK